MEPDYPVRKTMRLPDYDYAQCNLYFLTICTAERQSLFWNRKRLENREIPLSEAGQVVKRCIEDIPHRYEAVSVEKYCIMPDHVHLLLFVREVPDGRPMAAPTVSWLINQFKGAVSKLLGQSVWQRSFYDHVLRNEQELSAIWQYIDNNPLKYEVTSCL